MKWDGWDCFPRTPAGQSVHRVCPLSALQSHRRTLPVCLRGESAKSCEPEGKWHRIKMEGGFKEVTDYMDCSFVGRTQAKREALLTLVFQSISLVAVVISCFIHLFYKQYRSLRIQIHLNFFLSLALNSIGDILFIVLVRKEHLLSSTDNVINDK